jgi:glycosyltransferase involved in cell wall biosynthesis
MNDLTVVIPVRDGAATLGRAIGSVLERADGLLEIVVVDDGSRDASAAVAEALGPPVRVLRRDPAGAAAARNAGVAAARGRLLSFLDADDEWLAGVPDPRRALLDARPGAIALGHVEVEAGGRTTQGPLWAFGAALLARTTFDRVGGLDEGLERGEDVAWFLSARDAGVPLVTTDAPVMRYRRGPGSLSGDTRAGLLSALHATVRRRAAEA